MPVVLREVVDGALEVQDFGLCCQVMAAMHRRRMEEAQGVSSGPPWQYSEYNEYCNKAEKILGNIEVEGRDAYIRFKTVRLHTCTSLLHSRSVCTTRAQDLVQNMHDFLASFVSHASCLWIF